MFIFLFPERWLYMRMTISRSADARVVVCRLVLDTREPHSHPGHSRRCGRVCLRCPLGPSPQALVFGERWPHHRFPYYFVIKFVQVW